MARKTLNPDVLLDIVDRAMKMEYIPKEALLLAKRALSLADAANPRNVQLVDKASKLVELLEGMAARGRAQMGIVDGTVAGLREDLMMGKAGYRTFEATVGRLIETTQGTEIEVDGRIRFLRSRTFGAIERNEANGNQMMISGWSLGAIGTDRVVRIHFFLDGRLVDTVMPTTPRAEFGQGDKPIGFQFDVMLPVEFIPGMHCLVVSEFEDGTLGKLANGGDI